MFDFLDSIDAEQPFFYLEPCTRCLKCGICLMPKEEREGRYFWRCYCDYGSYSNVGLGAKNQLTGTIIWGEYYAIASVTGTPLGFGGVEPQLVSWHIHDFEVDIYDGECAVGVDEFDYDTISRFREPICCDGGFSSLLAAMLYYRREYKNSELTLEFSPLSYHDLMEALMDDPASRKFRWPTTA